MSVGALESYPRYCSNASMGYEMSNLVTLCGLVWYSKLQGMFSKLVKSLEQSIRRNKHLQPYSVLCCS